MELYGTRQTGPPSRCEYTDTDTDTDDIMTTYSRGRELENTGPSACEVERRAAMETSSIRVPSCESGGAFSPRQCQLGGACWCVDPTGRELPGTRQTGDALRRLALSRLFSGPVEPPSRTSSIRSSCLSLLRPIRELLPVEADLTSFLSRLVEVLHGVFPSVEGALMALARSSPRRLQENLFGGKFLKNAASFNFSGAVGAQGALNPDQLASQSAVLQKNQDLVQTISRALEDPAFLSALQHTLRTSSISNSSSLQQVLVPLLRSCPQDQDSSSIFVPSCRPDGGFHDVQCAAAVCWCVDAWGQEVTGSRTAAGQPRCPTRCEVRRATALKVKGNMAAGAEIHVPACSEDGDFLPLQCAGSRCFCVDGEGAESTREGAESNGSPGATVTCPERPTQTLRLAGLRLTPEELLTGQSEEELRISDGLLGRSKAALRLAAFAGPSWCELRGLQCRPDGSFVPLQCDVNSCWCVSEDGQEVGGTRTARRAERTPSCDRPLCPDGAINHGAMLCRPEANGRQACDLVCHRGYQNSLPVSSFLCRTESRQWDGDHRPFWSLSSSSCSQISSLQSALFSSMTSRGLCSAQLPVSGRFVSLCDASSVQLSCGDKLTLTLTWTAHLSDLPISDLPNLQDIGGFLNGSRLLEGVRAILGNVAAEPELVSATTASFGCAVGHRLVGAGKGCGESAIFAVRLPGEVRCLSGWELLQGGGVSPLSSGDLSGCRGAGRLPQVPQRLLPIRGVVCQSVWRCVDSKGAELEWTNSDKPLTDEECSACAVEPSCHHVALFNRQTQCELYSTHTLNTHCNTSEQDGCSRDTCCEGFLLNQNRLEGGSLLCGWLKAPSILMCGDQDWDVIGEATANRICGTGITYNEQQGSFLFEFGDQKFNITDALPTHSETQKDYQASIVSFQAVYLNSDNRVCGAYDTLRTQCRPLVARAPNSTYIKNGGSSVVCVSLLSLGVQTCSEDQQTSWRTQDCSRSAVETRPDPLGWYQKPACEEAESSCVAVSFSETASATRCVLYPDTTACGLSSAPGSPSPASSCRLVIREPAPQVYLRTGCLRALTVFMPTMDCSTLET
ncbi:Thyroglobulin [Liparis tanakae]|uniref:Thyroglobulin n=1 Tax=Liparis tanakae TaxID=230148 RepID=A0A4Z2FFN6_9TELE|nr:Thyroglobulin [Liparis tanakae]